MRRGASSAAWVAVVLARSVWAEAPAAPPPEASAAASPAALEWPAAESGVPPEIAESLGIAAAPDAAATPAADPAPAAAEPSAAAPEGASLIELAWQAPAADLDARVLRTRRAAVAYGAWSFDSAARALALDGQGEPALERSAAAVELAPDLPAAHLWRAEQLWLRGGAPMAAIRAGVDAIAAATRHLEASLWFGGSGLYLLAVALVAGGLLAIALAGAAGLPHAAHDLGHLLPGSIPGFARCAGLAALLGVPLALGEGALGLALGLLALALIYGQRAQRIAMLVAALGVGLGAYPVVRLAGAALGALSEDPVARAAYSVSQGIATPVDLARLEAASPRDPLALRGLAIHARRSGRLGVADTRYQQLLDRGEADVATLNNAANVRLDLGHIESALDLYQRAARREDPVVLFNLAQAYGRGFQVEDLNRTFARAQQLDGERVAALTALQATDTQGFVVDYPLDSALFWTRLRDRAGGRGVAAEFRAPFAPGRLGGDPRLLGAAGALVFVLGSLLGSRAKPSRGCQRCGDRVCLRCDPRAQGAGELCSGCHRLFNQPEKTDRLLRAQRVTELRARERRVERVSALLALCVPGAAGLVAKRPLSAWLGALCFALTLAAWVWRDGVVPDPWVAGAAASGAFVALALLSGLVYVVVVGASLASGRDR